MLKRTLGLCTLVVSVGVAQAQQETTGQQPSSTPSQAQPEMGAAPGTAQFQTNAPRDLVQKVENITREYEEAWSRHDAKKISSLYTNDATYLAANGQHATGRAELQQHVQQEHQGTAKKSRATMKVLSVRTISPTALLVDVYTRVEDMEPVQGRRVSPDFQATAVVVKQGNEWKILGLRGYPWPSAMPAGVGGAGMHHQGGADTEQPPQPER